jgi:hypothetical protein
VTEEVRGIDYMSENAYEEGFNKAVMKLADLLVKEDHFKEICSIEDKGVRDFGRERHVSITFALDYETVERLINE